MEDSKIFQTLSISSPMSIGLSEYCRLVWIIEQQLQQIPKNAEAIAPSFSPTFSAAATLFLNKR